MLDKWQHGVLEDGVVEVVISIKDGEMCCAIGFLELRLAVDAFVAIAEETVDKLAIVGCDAFETMFLDLAELRNHIFINLKILGTVLTWVAEGLASHASEGEEASHAERWIDQDAQVTSQLLGIHRAHGGGDDEVRLQLFHLLMQERERFGWHHGDVGCYDLHAVLVEGVAHAGGCAGCSAAGETV